MLPGAKKARNKNEAPGGERPGRVATERDRAVIPPSIASGWIFSADIKEEIPGQGGPVQHWAAGR
jgi:hypothetical protein